MSKKQYEGLNLAFVPVDDIEIVTASPSYCTPISVQYYIDSVGSDTCDSKTDAGLGEGYSYNLMKEPNPDW